MNENVCDDSPSTLDVPSIDNLQLVPGLKPNQYKILEYVRVAGKQINSELIYVPSEKMLYSKNSACSYALAQDCKGSLILFVPKKA